MKNRELKIFVDFDGTITQEDVGEAIFRNLGDEKQVEIIVDDLLSDKISSRDCWDRLCDSAPVMASDSLDKVIDGIEIDAAFHNLIDYCSKQNIELVVLSDGFDYYIERVFRKNNINGVKYYANKLALSNEGKLIPEYPFYNESFPTSSNCKRDHIINHSSEDDYTFYVGDGNSDKESAQYCDYIFAKNHLLKFCEKERISFSPFNNFDDVIKKIDDLVTRKKLRKSHQAELKRKAAYITE